MSFIPLSYRPSEYPQDRCSAGRDAPWPPYEPGKGWGRSAPQLPQIQGLRSPPEKKMASAAVITTRSNCALSRLKSATETKNRASTRIRTTLVVVAINTTPRSRHGSASRHLPRVYGESRLHFDLP